MRDKAREHRTNDLDFSRLDEAAFAACPADSIDYAVMERTQSAAMVVVDIGWSDIGSWSSLAEASDMDKRGNVLRGDVYEAETVNTYVRAESRMVAAIGVRDLVIVETADAVHFVIASPAGVWRSRGFAKGIVEKGAGLLPATAFGLAAKGSCARNDGGGLPRRGRIGDG